MSSKTGLSELNGGRVQYEPSLYKALENKFREHWTKPVVHTMHQDASHLAEIVKDASSDTREGAVASNLTWTYGQLHQGAVRLAAAYKVAGVKAGSTIVTLLPNSADWSLMFLSSIVAKTNFAALDVGALQPARKAELENFFTLLKPAVVVVTDATAATAVDAAIKATGSKVAVKLTGHWDKAAVVPQGWTDLDQVDDVDTATEDTILEEARTDDHERTSVTFFTSGTSTGRPKGCPRTVRSMLHNTRRPTQRFNDASSIRRLLDSANFRAICPTASLATWTEGGTVVHSGAAPTPDGALKVIEEYHVTDLVLVPAVLRMMISHPSFEADKVASVKTVIMAGDLITRSVLELVDQSFPNARAYNAHGMSEAGNLFYQPKMDAVYYGEVSSFGLIRPGARVKVVDEDKNIVTRGTAGELHIDSWTTINHYLENVNSETFYEDGETRWMKTGDTALIDHDGYIYILGRTKDIIKRAGVPITPGALETCLAPYANADAVVVGVEHKVLGTEPFAIMSSFGGKTEEELKSRVIEVMGKDYALGGAVTLKQLGYDTWPLNETDKVKKLDLRIALTKHLSSSAP